jgi:two-component system, LuxR family, sensor histidine kinase TtrS
MFLRRSALPSLVFMRLDFSPVVTAWRLLSFLPDTLRRMPPIWHAVLVCFLLVCCLAWPFASSAKANETHGDHEVRVGVLANRGPERAIKQWQPTADYLSSHVAGYRFQIVPLSFEQIDRAVANAEVDYVLANPAVYVGLEHLHGVSPVATLKNDLGGHEYALFGGVIFTRADPAAPQSVNELRGKHFRAVDANSLGGYLTALRELVKQGLHSRDFGQLSFGGTHDAVVKAVLAGEVDAGTVRTDILERMVDEGTIDISRIRLLKVPDTGMSSFPFLHNTRLYPEWPFAKLAHTPYGVAEKVATALLAMSSDDPAARAAGCSGWTVPLSYGGVHELLRELSLPPYQPSDGPGWRDVLHQYRYQVIAGVALLLASWLLIGYILRMNRRLRSAHDKSIVLNEQLRQKMVEQDALNRRLVETQSQLLQAEKMASVGLLAAGVAHEINTPLGYVTSNIGALERYTGDLFGLIDTCVGIEAELPEDNPLRQRLAHAKTEVDLDYLREDSAMLLVETRKGLDRVRTIVQGLRNISHPDDTHWQRGDLNRYVDEALAVAAGELNQGIEVVREYGDLPAVQCQPQAISQIFLNLVLNASHAMAGQGRLTLRSGSDGEQVWVEVRDTGHGIDPEHLEHVFDPFFTTKPVGMGTGLGLSICYGIAQRHHGRIEVSSVPGEGSVFRLVLPVDQPGFSSAGRSRPAG